MGKDYMEPQITPQIETLLDPSGEITQVIEGGLHEHNLAALGAEVIYNQYAKIAVVARGSDGAIVGGLLGAVFWGGLKIDVLWVDVSTRGQDVGSRLLAQAEVEARARGAALMMLETTSFQARGFYEKNGFSVYGQIDDFPKDHTWYHMIKRIA
jgi:ribosomal protein S18 acetylase RimI-like enzyme